MIFLGAGASKELGIPTLQELSEDVLNYLKEGNYEDVITEIISSLEEFNLKNDFESVYSIIEGLIDPESSVKKAGPFTAFIIQTKKRLPKKYNFVGLLKDMKKLLYTRCYLGRDKTNRIIEHYDPLFNEIKAQEINTTLCFKGHNYGQVSLDKIIATTNYDMSLELYFLAKGIKYIDGYDKIEGRNELIKYFRWEDVFDPFYKLLSNRSCEHLLIKLHGSIWQFEYEDELIKTNMDPNFFPVDYSVGEEMMIYPTREKEILNWKYYHFYNLFASIEWNKLLIIGYSFRDEPVNTAIL